jgi:hypothetical protein
MSQFRDKDSKRHFTVVNEDKEQHGLYVSSNPFSAAKKAVEKLCSGNKNKKVEFYLREITQGSNRKTYGPYVGYIDKLNNKSFVKNGGYIDLIQSGGTKKYKLISELSQLKQNANDKSSILVEDTNEFPITLFKNEKIDVIENNGKYGLVYKNGHMGYIKMKNLVPIDENDDSSTALLKAQKLWKKNQEKKQSEKERQQNLPNLEKNNIIRTLKQQLKNEESKGNTRLRNRIRSELLKFDESKNTYAEAKAAAPGQSKNSLSFPQTLTRENNLDAFLRAANISSYLDQGVNWKTLKPFARAKHFPPRRAIEIDHRVPNTWSRSAIGLDQRDPNSWLRQAIELDQRDPKWLLQNQRKVKRDPNSLLRNQRKVNRDSNSLLQNQRKVKRDPNSLLRNQIKVMRDPNSLLQNQRAPNSLLQNQRKVAQHLKDTPFFD